MTYDDDDDDDDDDAFSTAEPNYSKLLRNVIFLFADFTNVSLQQTI